MPFPASTLSQIAANKNLKALLRAYMEKEFTIENFDFYFSTESNQVKYNKYINEHSPHMINISHDERAVLSHLAQAGQWNQMTDHLDKAKASIERLIENNSLSRFNKSDEYSRWCVQKYQKLTDHGTKAFDLLKKDLNLISTRGASCIRCASSKAQARCRPARRPSRRLIR